MFKKRKKNSKLMILSVLFTLGIVVFFIYNNFFEKKEELKSDIKVLNTISEVLDLNVMKYNYSNIIDIKKDKSINDIKIPFTEKSFIIKYEGVVNAGINIDDVKILTNDSENIKIRIDKCKILEHYIKDESIYVYNIKESIFNKVEIQEVLEDITKHKNEYEEKLIEEGFIEEVKGIVKEKLHIILENMGYKNIELEIM